MSGKRYRVNDGTQVAIGEKIYVGGETFTATDQELDEHGSRPYVTEAGGSAAAAPKDKALAAPAPVATKKTAAKKTTAAAKAK